MHCERHTGLAARRCRGVTDSPKEIYETSRRQFVKQLISSVFARKTTQVSGRGASGSRRLVAISSALRPGAIGFDGGNDVQLIWPWQDRNRRFSRLKASTFALMLFPAVRTAYLLGIGDYGLLSMALPGLVYSSGVWATALLLIA